MPAPYDEKTSEGQGPRVDWAKVYAASSLQECADRYRGDPRRFEWLALGRGLEARLGGSSAVFDGLRPEVLAEPLPTSTVFILGAAPGPPPGCMGHVAARLANRTIGLPPVAESIEKISGSASVIEPLISRLVEVVRPLSPDAAAPRLEIVSPLAGIGDSHALAVAVSVMHALVGAEVPVGTAATGGYDLEKRRFRAVPSESLVSKARAAVRWGVKRILVVENQEIPAGARLDGLEWVRLPPEPAALPLQVLSLASLDPSAPEAPGVIQALRLSLAVYDMQVARALETPVQTVLDVTDSFLAKDGSALGDPVLAFLAADIRSRVLLHAGRSTEAAEWYRRAVSLLGRGDLPAGLLGDHLLYEHPAHASVLALDLGVLENDGDDGEPHRQLDAAIEDLDRRWCTRHQVLLRLFAHNTRWRRRLYLARWHLDQARLAPAELDLMAEHDRWHELLAVHATDGLGMGNSDLSRQWNYVIEHLVTEAALMDPQRFDSRRAGPPEATRQRMLEMPSLVEQIRSREADPGSLSTFDLRGLLQGWWLLGESGDEALERVVHSLAGSDSTPHHPRWAEWLWRFGEAPHGLVGEILQEELRRHQDAAGSGIGRILALRRAVMLDQADQGTRWLSSIAAPAAPETMVAAFENLRSTPTTILARSPY